MKDDPSIWFPAKRYGWGWGLPIRWQGWLAFVGYLGLVTLGAATLPVPGFILFAAALSGGFVLVCWWKGESPRWRWGGGGRSNHRHEK